MEEGEGEGQWHKQVVLRTAKKLDEWTLDKEGRQEVPPDTARSREHRGGSGKGVATLQSASRREGVAADCCMAGVETLTVFLTRPRLES